MSADRVVTFLGDVTRDFDCFLGADSAKSRELIGFARTPLYVNTEDLATILLPGL